MPTDHKFELTISNAVNVFASTQQTGDRVQNVFQKKELPDELIKVRERHGRRGRRCLIRHGDAIATPPKQAQ